MSGSTLSRQMNFTWEINQFPSLASMLPWIWGKQKGWRPLYKAALQNKQTKTVAGRQREQDERPHKMTDRSCISRAGTTRNRKARLFPAAQVTSSTHHETCTTRTVESEQMHSFPGEVILKHSALCGQGRLCTVSHLTFRINISESVSSIYLPLSPANDLPKVTMGMSGHSVLNPET